MTVRSRLSYMTKERTSGLMRMVLPLGLFLALSATNAHSQNGLAGQQNTSVEGLTQALLTLNLRLQTANSTEKSQLLNELSQLAQARLQTLAALVQSDPAAALHVALPSNLRSGLPSEVLSLVEQEVTLEGVLEVSIEEHAQESRLHHFLNVGGERLSLNFAADPPTHLLTGSVVRVHGVRIGSGLALTSGGTSSTSSVQTVSAALPNTFGAQKTLVILVNFQDNSTQPWTVATAQSTVFTTASNFWLENSFQKTWLTGDVAGWYTLPISSTTCNITSIQAYAKQAAQSAGYVLSNYDHFIYAFPQTSACGWWGWSYIGGIPSNSWINGNLQLQVVDHELGHALGLYHSHGLNCSGTVYATSGCTQYEYGDYYDIMASSTSMQYNAFQKERLGWLNYSAQPPIITVSNSGSFTIAPYESEDANPKALKILQSGSSGTYYYMEFRQPIGFDNTPAFTNSYGYNNVINGIVIHLASPSNANSSNLLNMNPSSAWDYAMALDLGASYTDSTAGVTITPTAVSSAGATVQVTFGSATCMSANPSVTVSPSQSQYVTAGTALTFIATVKDNDSSACSTASFDLKSNIPTGWTGIWNSSMLNFSPGGSGSATLTVTSPPGTASGFYAIGVSATNAAASSYAGSTSGTYVVSTAVASTITVGTNQSSYLPGQTVNIAITLLTGSSPVAGASVTATITGPNGKTTALTGTTGTNGVASLGYKLSKRASVGTYRLNSSASGMSASTIFAVQ